MSMTQSDPVQTPDLDRLYDQPREIIQKAVMPELNAFHAQYLAQATFFCLATGRDTGLDASPRGGPPGFVKVRDPKTVVFADWPGNNRIESMRNLQRDARVAMLFIFPGLEVFLRINGRAGLSTDADLLSRLGEGQRTPKAATVVSIDQVLMHCGKAINRAHLWDTASQLDRRALPTVGRMIAALQQMDDAQVEQIDARYDHSVRHDLY
jgi:PPOX class probable FMN-dependent enzyme